VSFSSFGAGIEPVDELEAFSMTYKFLSRSSCWALSLAVSLSTVACHAQQTNGSQGWSDKTRNSWYFASQGSRLMPYEWFMALESVDGGAKFASIENLESFGFVAPPEWSDSSLPIGFARDVQDDTDLSVSKLRWFEGQGSEEPWIGLNCSACHTAKISYQGKDAIIDGAASLLDFQSFIEELDKALVRTQSTPEVWDSFAAEVLGEKDTEANRAELRTAFDKLVAWQLLTDKMNETPIRYGYGRLDAVGHIFNKALMFTGAEAKDSNPADAPVSYPFIWDIWRQEKVQWNGVARNSRFDLPGDSFEYGALGRNVGEVLGVFGDVVPQKNTGLVGSLKGFESSVQTVNLERLERILQDLAAPRWPADYPPIDAESAARGQGLFKEKCASCHLTPDMQAEEKPTEVMVTFEATLAKHPENLTDIWMACNAYLYTGPTGTLEGMKDQNGEVMGPQAPVVNMLATTVKNALIGDKPALVETAFVNFFGIRRLPDIFEAAPDQARENARAECLNTKNQELLAYKARPLDGIWATAPYLHNGSVASLYELLLPAEERMATFWVGSREFDPVRVGYIADKPEAGDAFEFRVRDASGALIEGNSNAGHDYGAANFSDQDRMDLIEYMKGL
jgi:mono/diheme cytochrome c family protein